MLKYLSVFIFSTWKFMFAPIAGWAAGFSFFETFLVCISGGVFSASIFYFGSSYFMNLAIRRRARRAIRLEKKGKKVKVPKKFTRTNRRIIKVKRSVGIYGVTWMFPLFLSVPLGAMVTAKFYKHQKQTFPLIVLFLAIDCIAVTSLTFLLK